MPPEPAGATPIEHEHQMLQRRVLFLEGAEYRAASRGAHRAVVVTIVIGVIQAAAGVALIAVALSGGSGSVEAGAALLGAAGVTVGAAKRFMPEPDADKLRIENEWLHDSLSREEARSAELSERLLDPASPPTRLLVAEPETNDHGTVTA